jgi:hypothetical protein
VLRCDCDCDLTVDVDQGAGQAARTHDRTRFTMTHTHTHTETQRERHLFQIPWARHVKACQVFVDASVVLSRISDRMLYARETGRVFRSKPNCVSLSLSLSLCVCVCVWLSHCTGVTSFFLSFFAYQCDSVTV